MITKFTVHAFSTVIISVLELANKSSHFISTCAGLADKLILQKTMLKGQCFL